MHACRWVDVGIICEGCRAGQLMDIVCVCLCVCVCVCVCVCPFMGLHGSQDVVGLDLCLINRF